MKIAHLCTGINSAGVAIRRQKLGWEETCFSEISEFPNTLLQYYYPQVPNLGDMNNINGTEPELKSADIIMAGTPCQSFSIAGLRKGLDDPRGNITLRFLGILEKAQPNWVIWENVPGILSHDEGRTFGTFITALELIGYKLAYRVLDAQNFLVPQQRERIFLVGYLGDWRPPAAVLFESESLLRYKKKSRRKQTDNSINFSSSIGNDSKNRILIAPEKSVSLTTRMDRQAFDRETYIIDNVFFNEIDKSPALHTKIANGPVQNQVAPIIFENHGQDSRIKQVLICPSITKKAGTGGNNLPLVLDNMKIRKMTPLECERVMGFDDCYTAIPFKGKVVASDNHRYSSIGNSIVTTILQELFERINFVESLIHDNI